MSVSEEEVVKTVGRTPGENQLLERPHKHTHTHARSHTHILRTKDEQKTDIALHLLGIKMKSLMPLHQSGNETKKEWRYKCVNQKSTKTERGNAKDEISP